MEYIEDRAGRITFPITTNDKGWILQCGTTDSLEYIDFAITKTGKLEPWVDIRIVEEMFRAINDKRYPKDGMSVDELLFG